jgi:23S rRNA (cytosine1962-C5)-methyltransferase
VLEAESLANRLRKNFRRLRPWANRQGLGAFRIYDADMPEFPCSIDWYEGFVHLLYYPPRRVRHHGLEEAEDLLVRTVGTALEVPSDRIFWKAHAPMKWGEKQYGRITRDRKEITVREGGLKFWVNLSDYLDSGLFLDHRLTRARIREQAKGVKFLNLFCYTGSFTVYAAAGGAVSTTSVDLSRAYLDWAKRNLVLNHLHGGHQLIQADAVRWINQAQALGRYDLIVVDPPSYSSSKRMLGAFNVQRDHPRLLEQTTALLAPGGSLYFSTNFRGFQLDFRPAGGLAYEELTAETIPEDFRRQDIHRCWRFYSERAALTSRSNDH